MRSRPPSRTNARRRWDSSPRHRADSRANAARLDSRFLHRGPRELSATAAAAAAAGSAVVEGGDPAVSDPAAPEGTATAALRAGGEPAFPPVDSCSRAGGNRHPSYKKRISPERGSSAVWVDLEEGGGTEAEAGGGGEDVEARLEKRVSARRFRRPEPATATVSACKRLTRRRSEASDLRDRGGREGGNNERGRLN